MTLPRTPSQTVGPYYAIGLCRRPDNELVPPSDPSSLRLIGRLLDGEGVGIDGMIEVWDASTRLPASILEALPAPSAARGAAA